MIKLAADLQHAQQPANSSRCNIRWHRQLHPSMLPTKKSKAQQTGRQTYDLVVASYVLTEMQSDAARQQAIDMLWRQTKDVLVLVEPGTPSGSAYVRSARTQVRTPMTCMRALVHGKLLCRLLPAVCSCRHQYKMAYFKSLLNQIIRLHRMGFQHQKALHYHFRVAVFL